MDPASLVVNRQDIQEANTISASDMDTYSIDFNLRDVLTKLSYCARCHEKPHHIIGKLLPCGHMFCAKCLPFLIHQKDEEVTDAVDGDVVNEPVTEAEDAVPTIVINGHVEESDVTNPVNGVDGHDNDQRAVSDTSSETSFSFLLKREGHGRQASIQGEFRGPSPVLPWAKIPCPKCQIEFRLQDQELSNLQTLDMDANILNQVFHLHRACEEDCDGLVDDISEDYFCTDCRAWLCELCKTVHGEKKPEHKTVKGAVHTSRFAESAERCAVHNERITKFCVDKSCNIPVCQICCTITHSNHRSVPFNEASGLLSSRLGVVRKVNTKRHEVLKESRTKLIMKLEEERKRFQNRRQQIEERSDKLLSKLDNMQAVLCEKWENSLGAVNSEFIIAELVDKLMKAAYGQDKNIPTLVGLDKMFKTNKSWFIGSDTNYLLESGGIPIGLVDPVNDLLSNLCNDPAYRALLTDDMPKRFGSTMSLASTGSSGEGLKFNLHSHFVPSEIAAYLAKQNEELSQLSVKDITLMANSDFVFLVGFYSSSYGWENGILVLCPKGATGKQFRCKRAFSIRYQKHCFSRIAAFGTQHLILADSDNRCVVTYTINGKEVCTYSFSPNEVPRWVYVKHNKLLVSFRHEIKIYTLSVVGDVDANHRILFVLTRAIRGFEKESCVLEDAHISDTGEIILRAFPYADPTTRFREDPSFLNFRIYILNEEGRSSSKVSPISVTDVYGVCRLSPGVDPKSLLFADYNQCSILSVPFTKTKQKSLDMTGVQCVLSPLDGLEKLRSVQVSSFGDIITIENNDVKIYKRNV